MRVSVVMPVFNAQAHLGAALCSIRAQTMGDFELIVVDDGSSDSSLEIAAAHAAQDARLSVHRLPHGGSVRAMNHGLACARASFVAMMHADDEALPERLAVQLGFLQQREDVAALGSAAELIDAEGVGQGCITPISDPSAIRDNLPQVNCLVHPSVMMRRDLVREVGGYRAMFSVAEDYDLWLRLAERHPLANLSEVLLRYRIHGGQATQRRWIVQRLETLAAQQSALSRATGRGDLLDAYNRVDAATLRAIGVPRETISAALSGEMVSLPDSTNRRSGAGRS